MMRYCVYQPSLTGNEKKYVNECLDSTWISSKGRFIDEFASAFSKFVGVKHATGVCNGTVAIHLALVALGIGAGDEVIVPTYTYVASVNPIAQVGAKPVFVDSVSDTWQMSVQDIEAKISPRTRAIMVVHLYGHPCDMEAIVDVARRHHLLVIEDCAEAIGSEYHGRKVGSFGDIATFSFFGNKTITCGEGGMVVTNNDGIAHRAAHLKGQGLAAGREYWHDIAGFNYRMTNIQAAIGLAQLEQVDKFIAAKQNVAKWYMKYLQDLPIVFHRAVGNVFHTFWMCSILVEEMNTRNALREFLRERGIETRPTFFPVHTMPMYSSDGISCPVAEDISLRGINFPSYPALNECDIRFICEMIKTYFERN